MKGLHSNEFVLICE